ncbi:phage portal protein [Arhodomonas sp. AD133]|uniref:phage portal protein n=1 Tax=Arhodomonas sp. AD133 TaxID=3415009 RepID=UPI003EB6A5D6
MSAAPYQAASQGRRTRAWNASGAGPTSAATNAGQTLRNRARAQYRNDPYGRSAINKLVSNIIGTGIKPRSLAADKSFQAEVQALWQRWAPESDPEGLLSVYGQQMQAVNAWLQGGEAFLRARPRRPSDGLSVPLQWQVMEPEMCPLDFHQQHGANTIRHGIEFDPIGRRVAYWFYRRHPGEMYPGATDAGQYTRVSASEVIHLFDPVRPGQIRGTPQIASVLLRMWEVDKYDDATLMRQQIANLFAAFVRRRPPDEGEGPTNPVTGEEVSQSGDEPPEIALEPAMVNELDPEDEDVTFASPPSAGDNYADFLWQQLLATSAGSEVPYEVLTGDYSRINDRVARVILHEFRRRVQQMQQHIVIHQMCRRQWSVWLRRAVLSGALDAPGFGDSPQAYDRVRWIPQAWPYIHPQQDVAAQRESKRAGWKTQAEIISETTGRDIDDVYAELEAENKQADARGLVLDSDPRRTANNGSRTKPPEDTEE